MLEKILPVFVTHTYSDNDSSLGVYSNIVLTFSQAVQRGTGNIVISNGTDTRTIPVAALQIFVNGKTVTINPTWDLLPSSAYWVQLDSGAFRDLAGNDHAGIGDTTTLNLSAPDTLRPRVTTFSPVDNATAVAVDSNIVLTFSEAIVRGMGSIQIRSQSATGTVVESFDVATSNRLTFSGDSLTIDPTNDLDSSTKYFVTIVSGAVKDSAGNKYAGIKTYDFTTVNSDTIAPTVTSFSPADNASAVAVNSNIVLTFSEAVQRGTGNIVISNGTDTRTIPVGDLQISVRGKTVTINPTWNLLPSSTYWVQVDSGAFKDLAGNDHVGISDTTTFNFSTPDTLPPKVTSFSPVDNAIAVALDSNIVLTFTEAIVRGTGSIQIRSHSANGTVVESFNVATSNRLTFSGDSLTIDPTNDLGTSTKYFVTIVSGAVKDSAGNRYAGVKTYDFITVDLDTIAPTVTTFSPADNASAVAVDANIVLTFSEAVQRGTGNIVISNGTDTRTIPVDDLQIFVKGKTVTINPTMNLLPGSAYWVQMDSGAFRDLAGNDHAGISDTTTLNFTVAGYAPTLSYSTPRDNGTLEFTQNLYLSFSENVQAGSGKITLYKTNGSVVEAFDMATGLGNAGGVVGLSKTGVSIDPGANLVAGQGYYIQVDPTAVKDTTGNAYAGISDASTLNFTAVDSPPTLSSSSPQDNGTLEFTQNLHLYFSENVQAGSGKITLYKTNGSVVEAFNMATGRGNAGGVVGLSKSGVSINPGLNLVPGQGYYIQVDSTAVKDTTGNAYAGISDATTLNFTAVDPAPSLSYSTPYDNGTLEVTRNLYLQFSENVQAGSGKITLYKTNGSVVEAFDMVTGQGNAGGRVDVSWSEISIDPGANLVAGQGYYIQVDSTAVQDTTGNAYAGISDATTLNFTAVDPAPSLSYSTPQDNGTLEFTQNLYLQFSETVQAGSGKITLYKTNGTVVEAFDMATGQGNAGGRVDVSWSGISIDPGANLVAGQGYYIQVDSTAVQDTTGNAYAGISDATTLNFTAVDPVPTLSFSTPQDNGTLEVMQNLYLQFSETVQAGSGKITLYKTNGSVVEAFDMATGQGDAGGVVGLSKSGVSINPGANLVAGQGYYIQVDPTAVKDTTGNAYAGITDAATLNFTAVDSAPTLSSSWPQDNGTLEFTQNLHLYFSENVQAGSGKITLYKSNGSFVEAFDMSTARGNAGGRVDVGGSSISIDPGLNLVAGQGYYIQVDSTAVQDTTGNAYAGISDASTLNFTAVDSAPSLSSSSPQDNGTLEVMKNINHQLHLFFSENVQAGSGKITLYKTNGSVVEAFDIATGQGNAGGRVDVSWSSVSIDPGSNLVAGQGYYVQVDSTAVQDTTGNAYAGISDATTLNFTAVDYAPTLSSSTPQDNGKLEVTENLSFYFSENVQAGSGKITLYKSNGSVVEAFDMATGQGNAGGRVEVGGSGFRIDPGSNLVAGQGYYIQVDSTAVKDTTGNAYAGISDATTLNFTAVDSAPKLSSSWPEDNGTVEVTQNLYLSFSENVQAGSGKITLYKTNGSVVEAFDMATGRGNAGGVVGLSKSGVSINPGANLVAGQGYYIQVDSTAVKDTTGNAYAGISDASTLNFRAVDYAPTLSSSTPQDNGTVEVTQNLYLSFSETVQAGSGKITLYKSNGSVVEAFNMATGRGNAGGVVGLSKSGVSIDPGANLVAGQGYYIQVDSTAVQDTTGNAYAGISDATTLNFTASVPNLTLVGIISG